MSDLFDRAREALAVEELAGRLVTLRGRGDERRGSCPVCFAGEKSKSAPFKVSVARQAWQCFACGDHGDVADLWSKVYGVTIAEAAQAIAGPGAADRPAPKPRPAPAPDARDERVLKMAAAMWSGAASFFGSPAETYLRARGIAPAILDQLDGVRFHPECAHHWSEADRRWINAPAMIVKSETTAGWAGGVHATYLASDGLAKAALDPAKRMWGPQGYQGLDSVLPGGAWLSGRDLAAGDLVIGEGVETTLALASHLHAAGKTQLRIAAALSLNRLQGRVRRDADDCIDVFAPRRDPAAPPFLWPPCDTAITEPGFGVFIAIDRDMGDQRYKARTRRGRPTWFVLDAEARAKLCAQLTASAWRAKGWAFAEAMFPPRGMDWNDAWRAETRA